MDGLNGLLVSFFKRLLIYNSKIEELKKQIFEEMPKVDLISIFDQFDENKDGLLDQGEFRQFMRFMGFQIGELRITKVLYFFRDDESIPALNFIDFIKIFIPQHWNQEQTYQYFSDQGGQRFQLQKNEVQEMKKLLIINFKKIDDLTRIIQSLLEHTIEEVLVAINQSPEKNVSLKSLARFLEENEISFLEEDLAQILNELKVERMLEISPERFFSYFTREVWKLKAK